MSTEFLIILAFLGSTVGLGVLVLVFRYRLPDLVFLATAIYPLAWLSRLDEYHFSVGDIKYTLLWGVFASLFLIGAIVGTPGDKRMLRRHSRRVLASMAILCGIMVLSTIIHVRSIHEVLFGSAGLLFVILPFLGALGASMLIRSRAGGIQTALTTLCLATCLLGGMSAMTALFPGFLPSLGIGLSHKVYGEARAYSSLGGANGTGMVLVLGYSLAFGQLMAGRQKAISLAALVLAFVGVLTTLARGSIIGLGVSTIFLLFCQREGMTRRLLIVSIAGVLLLFPAAYKLGQYFTLERLNVSRIASGASTSLRGQTMRTSLRYALSHPILGGGWGLMYEKPRMRYAYKPGSRDRVFTINGMTSLATPHSLPALVLVETGGIGFVAFVFLILAMWKGLSPPTVAQCPHGTAILRGFQAAVLGFMTVSLVQDNLFLSEKVAYCFYLYLFTGLAAAAHFHATTQAHQIIRPVSAAPSQAPMPDRHFAGTAR